MPLAMKRRIRPLIAPRPGQWPCALAVMGAAEARRHADRIEATHQLSILDEGQTPRRLATVTAERHLHLTFADCEGSAEPQRPNMEHARAILAWTGALPPDARLLIHCLAGQSRSPAVALGILARHVPPEQAAEILEQIRPEAQPNTRLVAIFDVVLGLNGTLAAASAARFSFDAFLARRGRRS